MYQTSPFSFYIHVRSAPIITSIPLTKPYFQVNEQCTDFLVARHLALYTWYLGNSASPDGGQGRAMGWVYLLQLIHSPELHDSMECFIFLSIIIWGLLARTDRYISHSRTTRQNSACFTLFYLMGSLEGLVLVTHQWSVPSTIMRFPFFEISYKTDWLYIYHSLLFLSQHRWLVYIHVIRQVLDSLAINEIRTTLPSERVLYEQDDESQICAFKNP